MGPAGIWRCVTVRRSRASSLRHAVRWGDRRGDDGWRERPVRLRFHLRDASLYGFGGGVDGD